MKYQILNLLLFVFIVFSIGCGETSSRSYDFTLPVTIYPVKQVYSVGDTIWLEINIPADSVEVKICDNVKTNSWEDKIALPDFDFGALQIYIAKLVDSTQTLEYQPNGLQLFDHGIIKGISLDQNGIWVSYKLNRESNYFKFKFWLICKENGLYNILNGPQVFNIADRPGWEVKVTGNYDREYIMSYSFPVNRQNNGTYMTNFGLYTAFMDTSGQNNIIPWLKSQTFTFKVQ
jgi:hypothetical protein